MSIETFFFLSANGQKIYSFLNKFFTHEKNNGILEIRAKIQNLNFDTFYRLKNFIEAHPEVKHVERTYEIEKFDAYNRRLVHNHQREFMYVIKKELYETIILENNVHLSAFSEQIADDFDDAENGFVDNKNLTSYSVSSFLRIDFAEIIEINNCKYEIEIKIDDFHTISSKDMETIANQIENWLKILQIENPKQIIKKENFDQKGFEQLYDVFVKSAKRTKMN